VQSTCSQRSGLLSREVSTSMLRSSCRWTKPHGDSLKILYDPWSGSIRRRRRADVPQTATLGQELSGPVAYRTRFLCLLHGRRSSCVADGEEDIQLRDSESGSQLLDPATSTTSTPSNTTDQRGPYIPCCKLLISSVSAGLTTSMLIITFVKRCRLLVHWRSPKNHRWPTLIRHHKLRRGPRTIIIARVCWTGDSPLWMGFAMEQRSLQNGRGCSRRRSSSRRK
jgi:hypothetical protein